MIESSGRAARRRTASGLLLALLPALAVAIALAAPVFAAAFPGVLRVPHRDPEHAGGLPPARFSHRGHAAFACFTCHPGIFPQALEGFSHQEMDQGHFCGRCHDGGVAFAIKGTACGDCHAPE